MQHSVNNCDSISNLKLVQMLTPQLQVNNRFPLNPKGHKIQSDWCLCELCLQSRLPDEVFFQPLSSKT